nr:hypothetical protein [Arthrospira sp. PLM2.Bin9]
MTELLESAIARLQSPRVSRMRSLQKPGSNGTFWARNRDTVRNRVNLPPFY